MAKIRLSLIIGESCYLLGDIVVLTLTSSKEICGKITRISSGNTNCSGFIELDNSSKYSAKTYRIFVDEIESAKKQF